MRKHCAHDQKTVSRMQHICAHVQKHAVARVQQLCSRLQNMCVMHNICARIQKTAARLQHICAPVQKPCCNTVHIVGQLTRHTTQTQGSTRARNTNYRTSNNRSNLTHVCLESSSRGAARSPHTTLDRERNAMAKPRGTIAPAVAAKTMAQPQGRRQSNNTN